MSSYSPFFSIVIPTFNSEKVIDRCLASIDSQSFKNYEVVIVDGLSNDNTVGIVKRFASINNKIKFVADRDKGTYDAMNKGIDIASGDWICFLGSDDELHDCNVLANIVKTPLNADEEVMYGNALIVNESSWAKDNEVYDGPFNFAKLIRRNICHQAIFYNRSFLNKFGLRYNLSYPLLADWDFNLQCFAKTRFHYIDIIISKFFSGGQTTAENRDDQFSRDFVKNIATYFGLLPFDKTLDQLPGDFLPAVTELQKKQSFLRYYFQKTKTKIRFKSRIKSLVQPISNRIRYPHNRGYCTICEADTVFFEFNTWLRDYYHCIKCKSIPRHRALVKALNTFYPEWRDLSLHESSPGGSLSDFLKASCKKYSASHYFENIPRGKYFNGFRSEDLTNMTFEDESIDLLITSDVFEHVFEPGLAFKEIARVLKPGGAHIFTMPWYPAIKKSVQRAKLENGGIVHLKEPVYHGNPIISEGSLVTYDWGIDFCSFIYNAGGMHTTIYLEKNRHLGLEAEFLEVFVSIKQ